jgi:DNA-binding response OmpR family regulator
MLIIEDDLIVSNIYRHKFQAEGFQVELAGDGESGLAATLRSKPHVIILDLMLPKLNGVEVLRKIRAEPTTRDLPVIVLSNAYMSNLIQEAWKAGANYCMVKANCTPRQLADIVNKTLGATPQTIPAPPIALAAESTPALPPDSAASHDPAPAGDRSDPSGRGRSLSPSQDDAAFQTELRRTFLASAPADLAELRALLQTFIKTEGDAARLPKLFSLYRKVHSLTSNSGVAAVASMAKLSSALEALLKELYEKPKNLNASTLRTLAHTIDLLAVLLEHSKPEPDNLPAPNILVVDDEAISRRAVIYALEKAHLKCISVEDSNLALKMISENQFDLIFLDVDMPGMNGFELCTKLRALPAHAKTPVIFVTGLTDFESRARSTLSGGNDLIAKPFLFMELAVKALSYVLKGQLGIARP